MRSGESDDTALCTSCGVQVSESEVNADGECRDCQHERQQSWHVVMWVRGTLIVYAGVFSSEKPGTHHLDTDGAWRTVLYSARGSKARDLCKAWYRENLPSVERAYPLITLIAALLLVACNAPTTDAPDASEATDARRIIVAHHDAGGVDATDAHIVTSPDTFSLDAFASIDPDAATVEPDAACIGRCTFGGTSYYWQACPGEPLFRCGGACDPRGGCIDAGPP